MSYAAEFKSHFKPLIAATLGLAFGMSINTYTTSLFGAHIVKAFGWSRADFALMGTFPIALFILFPIAGRLADVVGVKRAALIGILGTPLTFVGLSQMGGDIRVFFALTFAQLLLGAFTSATVYNRVVAERFVTARGLAFAIVMSGPPLAGAIAAPLLGDFITAYGWRNGYLLMGAICFGFSLLALALLPPVDASARRPSNLRADFATVSRSPVFWLLALSMFLCNLPQAVGASQLMLMLAEQGVSLETAGFLSIYPVGVIIGRLATGLALDRFAPQIVGCIGLALPGLGFVYLASPYQDMMLIGVSVLLMGLAQGAEGDVASYLVGRHFPLAIFASVAGLVNASTAVGASVGAIILRPMLAEWDSYTPFLIFSAVVTIIGALLLLFIRNLPEQRDAKP